jgi:glutathione S-transferase
MKLYYYKGACSLAVRIIINELNIQCSFESVKELQVKEKITESGRLFSEISHKNQIPALELADGRILTEVIAISFYLIDLKNDKFLVGEGFTKYRVLEWLSFIATEMHKNFIPNISPIVPEEAKPVFKRIFLSKLRYVEKELEGKEFITGANFTLADAYLFVVLSWLKYIKIELDEMPNIARYTAKLKARPSIEKSLKEESLI